MEIQTLSTARSACPSVVNVFEIDSVVLFGDFDYFVPLARHSQHVAEQIVPVALHKKFFGFVDRFELQREQTKSYFDFFIRLFFTSDLGSSVDSNIAESDQR